MDRYKYLVCKFLEMCEEAAKLTDATWDDSLASISHDILCRWLGVVHQAKVNGFRAPAAVEGQFSLTAEEASKLPEWLKKILLVISQLLPVLL